MTDLERLVGTTWDSVAGPRRVVGVGGRPGAPRVLIQTGDSPMLALLPPDELEREIRLDTSRLPRVTRGTTPTAPLFDDLGFTSQYTPRLAARKAATLSQSVMRDGRLWVLGELIKHLVSNGSVVVEGPGGRRRLVSPEGTFLDERQTTKTGMDFADYLGP